MFFCFSFNDNYLNNCNIKDNLINNNIKKIYKDDYNINGSLKFNNDFLKVNSSVLNIEICNPIFYKNDKKNYILLKLTDENKKMISNISFANVNNNYICSIDYNYNDEKHIIICNLTFTI